MPATMEANVAVKPRVRRTPAAQVVTFSIRGRVGERAWWRRILDAAFKMGAEVEAGGDVANVVVLRDPAVLGGKAVIGGTRIPVFRVVDLYGEDRGIGSVLGAYPELTEEEIMVAVIYAARFDAEGVADDREQYYRSIPESLRA